MNPPEHSPRQSYRADDLNLAVIGERVAALGERFAEHVQQDALFQDQMMGAQAEVGKTLKAIEISMAGWRGTAVAAVAAISAVWAVVVLLIQFWNK